ncbi:MAG: hypothetical protein FJY83_03275 [Candidatus Aminicenantes bacterium]|nr:hypothetical protein [Candidatus Aminicenantes bacterium]
MSKTESEKLKRLFTSVLRVKLLRLFSAAPEAKIHIREAARRIGEDAKNVHRELKNLEALGLLRSEAHGNQKQYFIDVDFPLAPEIQGLLLKSRTGRSAGGPQDARLRPDRRAGWGTMTPGESAANVAADVLRKRWSVLVGSRVGRQDAVAAAARTILGMRRKIPGWFSVEEIRKWRGRGHAHAGS